MFPYVQYRAHLLCPDQNSENAVRSSNSAIHNRYNIQTSVESEGRAAYVEGALTEYSQLY